MIDTVATSSKTFIVKTTRLKPIVYDITKIAFKFPHEKQQ